MISRFNAVLKPLWFLLPIASIIAARTSAVAQTGPINFNTEKKKMADGRSVRAVVVGVSHYNFLDSAIQLHYAHKDAEDFRNLLLSSGVPRKNIWCRTNDNVPDERETMGVFTDFAAATQKDDLLIFYFSGHGDLQIKSDPTKPKGYLLLQNVKPKEGPYYKTGDALHIDRIRDEAAAIEGRGGQVLIITDACRKGKFPSTEENSTLTSAALNIPWSMNVSKLISCKPEQKSFEFGKPYNHGVFTYYLLRGIEGDADADMDDRIFFNELEAYLRASVNKITKSQTPDTYSYSADLFLFKKTGISNINAQETKGTTNAKLLGKSINDDNLFIKMSATQAMEDLLETAIEKRNLLKPVYPDPKIRSQTVFEHPPKISTKVHAGNAIAIAFSPIGSSFATVGEDKNLLLWSLDCKVTAIIPYLGNGTSLCFSPDGRYIAIGTWGQKICIADLNSRTIVPRRTAAATDHLQDIRALAFSDDGSLLASGGYDTDIKIWETKTWTQVGRTLSDHTQKIHSLVFTPKGKGLVSLGTEGELISWDLENFSRIGPVVPTGLDVTGIQRMAVSNEVLVGSRSGDLLKFNLELPVNKWKKSQVTGDGNFEAFAADAFGFIDLWGGRAIRAYSSEHGQQLQELQLDHKMRAITVDKTGSYAAGVLFGGYVFLCRVRLPYAYAVDIYDMLIKQADAAPYIEHYTTILTAALESSLVDVIKPFITGQQQLPDLTTINEAYRRIDYLEKMNINNTRVLRRAKCDKILLEVFKILQESEVSRFVEASRKLQELIVLEPDEAYHINILGKVYQRMNEIAKASAQIQEASERMPLWIIPPMDMAQLYFSESQYNKAIQQCEKVIKIAPELAHGYACRSEINMFLGRYQSAQHDLYIAGNIDSLKPWILNLKARLEFDRGNTSVALDILNKSLNLDGSFYKTHLLFGETYFFRYLNGGGDVNDIQKAYDAYWRAILLHPDNPAVLMALVNFYVQLGGLSNVEAILQRIRLKQYTRSGSAGASRRQVTGISANEAVSSVMELYTEIQKLSELTLLKAPFDPDSYAASGYALYGAARAKLPYEKRKMTKLAEEKFKKGISQCPNSPKAYVNYAEFLMTLRNYKLANKVAMKAVSKDVQFWKAYYLVARSYSMMGKVEKGIQFLEGALKYDSGPLIEYQLALIQRKNNLDEYKEHLHKALENDPDFLFAAEMLRNPATGLIKY